MDLSDLLEQGGSEPPEGRAVCVHVSGRRRDAEPLILALIEEFGSDDGLAAVELAIGDQRRWFARRLFYRYVERTKSGFEDGILRGDPDPDTYTLIAVRCPNPVCPRPDQKVYDFDPKYLPRCFACDLRPYLELAHGT